MQAKAPIPVRIDDVNAYAVALEGERLHLLAGKAYPPGKPLALQLEAQNAETLALSGRALGSKRRDDGQFELVVRLVNLSRAARLQLTAAFERPA